MILRDHDLEIRPISDNDIQSIFEVYQACEDFLSLGPEPKASLKMVKADLDISREENGIFCGIFDKENKMIGIIDFVPKLYDDKRELAFLMLLMIAKPYRNHGIGARVVRLVEEQIKKDEMITYIYSGVQVNNQQAIKFWGRMGYEIYSGPKLLPDKTTVYHLRKKVIRA